MNADQYHNIVMFLRQQKTNITELTNIQNILSYVSSRSYEEGYVYDEEEVINYVCAPYYDLKFDEELNIELLFDDMVKDRIIIKQE